MTTHECPGNGCERQVAASMLACRTHWYRVSKQTRARVWAAYRAGSDDHLPAMQQAIKEMNASTWVGVGSEH